MSFPAKRIQSSRALFAMLTATLLAGASARAQSVTRFENFNSDPQWDGLRNRSVPNPGPTVTQNFGYKASTVAGGAIGELGGHIERTTRPAWYADDIQTKTFNDVLTASGKISMPSQSSSAGLHFGWFNSLRQGWRPWSSIGFRLDGQGSHSNILLDYMTQTWRAGGVNLGSSNPLFRIPHNNSDHTWQMQYDPNGNSGGGSLSFTLDNNPPAILNLSLGDKAQGATFNRFGLWNQQASSGGMDAYFDDVTYDGNFQAFNNSNTGWEANGNNVTFQDPEPAGAHNYGWSNTNRAAGTGTGELGGLIFRTGVHAETYYGAKTDQNLTLNNALFASGKVSLVRGASDGALYFGWFNKQSIENTVEQQPQVATPANFLAVTIEGPSRAGHYFRPVFATTDAERRDSQDGPVIFPDGTPHNFTMLYDPAANNGLGKITVTLDSLTKEFNLTASDRAEGAIFDHFGMFGLSPGGHYVEAYFDDLTYTVGFLETPTWIVNASGNWSTASNWANNAVPGGIGATATLGDVITANRLVNINSSVILGTLNIGDAQQYVLAGVGTLTMQVAAGTAQINVTQGSHKINVPLIIASNTQMNIASGTSLILADPVTVNANRTLSKIGTGTVTYQSIVTLGAGASLLLEGSALVAGLAIGTDSKVDLSGNLTINGSDYGDITSKVKQGLNGGDWKGNGITSSAAANDPNGATALGTADGDDGVMVKYTYYGDTNLDGSVGLEDFEQFVIGKDIGHADWTAGDFDYNGAIGASDFHLFLRGLVNQGRNIYTPDLYAALSSFASSEGLSVDLSAVPEPASVGLLGIGALAAARRRRLSYCMLRDGN